MLKRLYQCVIVVLLALIAVPTDASDLLSAPSERSIVSIAHRGASGRAPEHTWAALDLANEVNSDFIELDLQMTKDGVLVAMHDATVDRTTSGSGKVKELTWKELNRLDAGSWFNARYPGRAAAEYTDMSVLALEDILREYGSSMNYCIEIKSPETNSGIEAKLVAMLERHHLLPDAADESDKGRVMIQSFSEISLMNIRKLQPKLPLIKLVNWPSRGAMAKKELERISRYASGVGPNFARINERYVQRAMQSGLAVYPYTVNRKKDMAKLYRWGVTGIITNYPERLHQVMSDLAR